MGPLLARAPAKEGEIIYFLNEIFSLWSVLSPHPLSNFSDFGCIMPVVFKLWDK
jgi:hypothetical protein